MEMLNQNSYAILAFGTLLIVILCQIAMKILNNKNNQSQSHFPPGSTGLPFIGETLKFMKAIKSENGFYDFVQIRRTRYGNCFKTNIFGGTHVFVSSTSSAKVILNNETGKFTKRYIKSVAELIGSKSILCAPIQHHKLIRGRLSNLVSSSNLSLFVKQFDQLVVQCLSSWEHRDSVVVLDEALKITSMAMCKMLMSLDNGSKLEVLGNEVALLCKALLSFPIKLPGTRFHKGLQARKRIMKMIENEIHDRRSGSAGQHDDLLERLLDLDGKTSYDSSNRIALDDEDIKDNILTIIIAGQDTTASAITWTVKYLDENKDVLSKLRKEHLKLAKKKQANEFLTLEDLNDMSYASKVVKETLRKASVVAWFPRLVLGDCEITEGYSIKKGWSVNIDAKQVHHDPTVYNDPYSFNPSRFEDDSKPYSFLAFGMGARTCLGINLAKSMMLIFIHRLITTYRWKVTNVDTSVEKMAMFTRLRSGCPMIVERLTSDDHDDD